MVFSLLKQGNRMTLENGLTELLSLKNVSIVNIKDPMPGNWRLRYSSEGGHTVRVTGLSSADFVTGFSKHPTKDLSQTNLRPIQGSFLKSLKQLKKNYWPILPTFDFCDAYN